MSYYHYCTTEAFFQIVKNKTIWLSSLTSSNDSMEGKWVAKVLSAICDENGISASDKNSLFQMVSIVENSIDCLGFCMSAEGDALSQWRGYAADGAGVSIRFSSDFIESFSRNNPKGEIYLQRVVYDPSEQHELIQSSFPQIARLISEGALKLPRRGTFLLLKSDEEHEQEKAAYREKNAKLFRTVLDMPYFAMKNPAFSEEREWRLAMMILRPLHEGLEFRARGARIVPYRQIAFPEAIELPIAEVVLGPKNPTPVDVMKVFLAGHGMGNVTVRVSSASYR